jgi:hypothetical protein
LFASRGEGNSSASFSSAASCSTGST